MNYPVKIGVLKPDWLEDNLKSQLTIKLCLRCGHDWASRKDNPTVCPKCKSPYWNIPRKETNTEKQKSRDEVKKAVKNNSLIRPEICENCSEKKPLHAHHDDYDKPLEVKWLCRNCHMQYHGKLRRKSKPTIPTWPTKPGPKRGG